jgi:hypothetical protein
MTWEGDQSPSKLTIAQALLLNLRGQEYQAHLHDMRQHLPHLAQVLHHPQLLPSNNLLQNTVPTSGLVPGFDVTPLRSSAGYAQTSGIDYGHLAWENITHRMYSNTRGDFNTTHHVLQAAFPCHCFLTLSTQSPKRSLTTLQVRLSTTNNQQPTTNNQQNHMWNDILASYSQIRTWTDAQDRRGQAQQPGLQPKNAMVNSRSSYNVSASPIVTETVTTVRSLAPITFAFASSSPVTTM